MSIYRWAKLDDQSGPDRSIELKGPGQVRDHRCGHTETTLARRSGADDVLACGVVTALFDAQFDRRDLHSSPRRRPSDLDRSIELKGSGQVRDHLCGHTETALARRSGADDVL